MSWRRGEDFPVLAPPSSVSESESSTRVVPPVCGVGGEDSFFLADLDLKLREPRDLWEFWELERPWPLPLKVGESKTSLLSRIPLAVPFPSSSRDNRTPDEDPPRLLSRESRENGPGEPAGSLEKLSRLRSALCLEIPAAGFSFSLDSSKLRRDMSKLPRPPNLGLFDPGLFVPLNEVGDRVASVARTVSLKTGVVDRSVNAAKSGEGGPERVPKICLGSLDAAEFSTTERKTSNASLPKLKNEKKYYSFVSMPIAQ